MSYELPGLPESIERTRLLELLAACGVTSMAQLISFRVVMDAVEFEVYALNAEGKKYFAGDRDEQGNGLVATHKVTIPVTPTAAAIRAEAQRQADEENAAEQERARQRAERAHQRSS